MTPSVATSNRIFILSVIVALIAGYSYSAASDVSKSKHSWLRPPPAGVDVRLLSAPDYRAPAFRVIDAKRSEAIALLKAVSFVEIGDRQAAQFLGRDEMSAGGPYYLLRGVCLDQMGAFEVLQKSGTTLVHFGTMGVNKTALNWPVIAHLKTKPREIFVTASTDE